MARLRPSRVSRVARQQTQFGELDTTPTNHHFQSPEQQAFNSALSNSREEIHHKARPRHPEVDTGISDADLMEMQDSLDAGATTSGYNKNDPSSPNDVWDFSLGSTPAFSSPNNGLGGLPDTVPIPDSQYLVGHQYQEKPATATAADHVDFSETATTARRSSPCHPNQDSEADWDFGTTPGRPVNNFNFEDGKICNETLKSKSSKIDEPKIKILGIAECLESRQFTSPAGTSAAQQAKKRKQRAKSPVEFDEVTQKVKKADPCRKKPRIEHKPVEAKEVEGKRALRSQKDSKTPASKRQTKVTKKTTIGDSQESYGPSSAGFAESSSAYRARARTGRREKARNNAPRSALVILTDDASDTTLPSVSAMDMGIDTPTHKTGDKAMADTELFDFGGAFGTSPPGAGDNTATSSAKVPHKKIATAQESSSPRQVAYIFQESAHDHQILSSPKKSVDLNALSGSLNDENFDGSAKACTPQTHKSAMYESLSPGSPMPKNIGQDITSDDVGVTCALSPNIVRGAPKKRRTLSTSKYNSPNTVPLQLHSSLFASAQDSGYQRVPDTTGSRRISVSDSGSPMRSSTGKIAGLDKAVGSRPFDNVSITEEGQEEIGTEGISPRRRLFSATSATTDHSHHQRATSPVNNSRTASPDSPSCQNEDCRGISEFFEPNASIGLLEDGEILREINTIPRVRRCAP